MNNLKQLVKIKSDDNKEDIINYIEYRFEKLAKEILIIKNKENEDKSILIGLNTQLAGVNPHRVIRTHRYC